MPEDIPLLGIGKGPVDLRRFFRWNVFRLFYRPDFTLDRMSHVNFDWLRPLNCQRQTPDEVRRWCKEAGLEVKRMNVQESVEPRSSTAPLARGRVRRERDHTRTVGRAACARSGRRPRAGTRPFSGGSAHG